MKQGQMNTKLRSYMKTAEHLSPHVILLQAGSAILTAGSEAISATFIGKMVSVLSEANHHLVWWTLGIFLGLMLILGVCSSMVSSVAKMRTQQINLRAQTALSERMVMCEYKYTIDPKIRKLYSSAKAGLEFTGGLQGLIEQVFAHGVSLISTLVFSGSAAVFILSRPSQSRGIGSLSSSPLYYSIIVVILIVPLISAWYFSKKGGEIKKEFFSANIEYNRKFDYYTSVLFRNEAAARVLKTYDEDDTMMLEAQKTLINGAKRNGNLQIKANFIVGLSGVIGSASIGILYVLVALKTFTGAISIGQVVSCVGYLELLITALMGMLSAWGSRQASLMAMDQYIEFMRMTAPETNLMHQRSQSSNDSREKKLHAFNVQLSAIPSVECRHITYRYPGAAQSSVKDVSFTLHPGERLAIVGENGSGKTTLVKLLIGLLSPKSGEILLDNTNAATIDKNQYFHYFAPVFQNFSLFGTSIKDNIIESQPWNEEKFHHALSAAGIKDQGDSMKLGADTPISKELDTHGVNLSGGERQKIAIARAIYKDSPIMILDEPTAALDPRSEAAVFTSFNTLIKNKSAIYISHRMSSTKFCDRILVMDHGSIAEVGTHGELMNRNGIYARLFKEQAVLYELDSMNKS